MYNIIQDIIDAVRACFQHNLTWSMVLKTYWFLFFVEFPRYYLLEIVVVINCTFRYWQLRNRKEIARWKLRIEQPLVSIIVPGKNEGAHIFALVSSLAQQTYKNFEVIIIDDGSDDTTPLICRDLEKDGYIDRYLRLDERGGKASAANYGLYYAHGKYIVHLDADSSLDRSALEDVLIPFYYNEKIGAVGGCVKVRNGDESLCAALQQLEYLKTIQVGRLMTSQLGIYHIISGAFGAFRADVLKDVGGWDIGPGLDGDITQKIRKAGFNVMFAHDAIALTDVPTSWRKLFKQRMRWNKSLIRFRLRKHSDILLPTKNFKFSNFFSNMDNIVYDCVMNYIWVIYMFKLIFENIDRLLEILVIGWIIRWAFSIVSFLVIMLVSERAREEKKLALILPLSTFYTGYFLRIARLIAHTSEIFFFSSYNDKWNPKKTSSVARVENI